MSVPFMALNEGRDSRPGNGLGNYLVRYDPSTALNEGRDSRPGNGAQRPDTGQPPDQRAQRGPGLASRQRTFAAL